jgi:hypothetical protein
MKRLIIVIVYLIIFFAIGFTIYLLTKPKPTCFDGKQNQNEEKVDCGGPCNPCEEKPVTQDLQVKEKAFVYGGPGRYDIMARIYNPNNQYGSAEFSYKFILKDSSGNKLVEREGKSFILPAETKYVLGSNLETPGSPQVAEIELGETRWEEFAGFEEPQLNIYHKQYNAVSSQPVFSEATGLLRNESTFDFAAINISVVLRDASGAPVAFNSTAMNTVNAGEERDFRLIWPLAFPGEVRNVEMEAEADVFDSQNFLRRYLPESEFQKYQ